MIGFYFYASTREMWAKAFGIPPFNSVLKEKKKWVVQVGYILKWKYPLAPIQEVIEPTFTVVLHTRRVVYWLDVSESKFFFFSNKMYLEGKSNCLLKWIYVDLLSCIFSFLSFACQMSFMGCLWKERLMVHFKINSCFPDISSSRLWDSGALNECFADSTALVTMVKLNSGYNELQLSKPASTDSGL